MENIKETELGYMVHPTSDYINPEIGGTVLVFLGLVTVTIKVASVRCIIKNCLKWRPVDTMFVSDQVGAGSEGLERYFLLQNYFIFQVLQTFVATAFHMGAILRVMAGSSVNDFLNYDGACDILYVTNVVMILNIIIGSFGMAFYRLCMIRWPVIAKDVIGTWPLAMIIRGGEWTLMALIIFANVSINRYKQYVPAIEGCRNRNIEMSIIMNEYNGITLESHVKASRYQSLLVLLCVYINVCEVICYVTIYKERIKNDKRVKDLLPINTVQRRIRGNVVTYKGQLLHFGCKLFLELSLILLINFHTVQAMLPIVFSLQQTLLATAQVFASPELRRQMFCFEY